MRPPASPTQVPESGACATAGAAAKARETSTPRAQRVPEAQTGPEEPVTGLPRALPVCVDVRVAPHRVGTGRPWSGMPVASLRMKRLSHSRDQNRYGP